MIKVISITNAHKQWDNVVLSDHIFIKLLEILEYSNFVHTVTWQKDGQRTLTLIK